MDGYHVALFIHLLAIVAAAVAGGLTHLAFSRAARADTVGEVLQWGAFAGKTARTFPIAILTLLATGGYMVGVAGVWSFRAGWVQVGGTAAVLMLAFGGVMGARQGRAGKALAKLQAEHGPRHPIEPGADPVAATLLWVNPAMALSTMFVMTTKPSLMASAGVLLLGIALGLMLSRIWAPKPASAPAGEVALG